MHNTVKSCLSFVQNNFRSWQLTILDWTYSFGRTDVQTCIILPLLQPYRAWPRLLFKKCFKATSKYLFPEHYLCTLFYSKLHVFYLHRNVHQLLTNFQSVIYNNGHVNTHSQSIMLFPSPPRVLIQKQAYLSYRFIFSIPSQYCKKTNLCP